MSKIIIVTVPYITSKEHYDLAVQSIDSFVSGHELVNVAVINKCDKQYRTLLDKYDYVIENDENILARAWNLGVDKAEELGYDYVFIPNLDVRLRKDTIDELVKASLDVPDALLWAATQYNGKDLDTKLTKRSYSLVPESYSFSCYMIDKKLREAIGRFYEGYKPAYYEDLDTIDRIHASNNFLIRSTSALFHHYQNQTRRNDQSIGETLRKTHPINEQIYQGRRKRLFGD